MKKITMIGIILFSGLMICPTIITEAVEKDNNVSEDPQTQSYMENVFSDLNDTDKVLEMPNGGFLYGEATVINPDGSSVHYNSATDSNSKTVLEAKSSLKDQAATGNLKYE